MSRNCREMSKISKSVKKSKHVENLTLVCLVLKSSGLVSLTVLRPLLAPYSTLTQDIQNNYRQPFILRAIDPPITDTQLFCWRISCYYRDRFVEMLTENVLLQIKILPWIPVLLRSRNRRQARNDSNSVKIISSIMSTNHWPCNHSKIPAVRILWSGKAE